MYFYTFYTKNVLFHFHFSNVELYIVISCLTHSYCIVFCDLVKTYIDGPASTIGIPSYLNKYNIFIYNKTS